MQRLWKDRKVSLQMVLILPFVLQIFGAVGLVGYLSFKNGQKAVKDLADQLIDKASQQVDSHLDSYLALPVQLVQMNVDAIAQGEVDLNDPIASGRYFWRQAKAFPSLTYIGIARPDGAESGAGRWVKGIDLQLYENQPQSKASDYAADSQGNRAALLQQYEYQPLESTWYQAATVTKKLAWGDIEVIENQDIEFTAAGKALQSQADALDGSISQYVAAGATAPIYDSQQNLLAVMNIDLTLTGISDFLRSFQVSPAGQVFIIERDGMLIGSSSPYPVLFGADETLKRVSSFDSSDPLIQTVSRAMRQQFGNFQTIQSAQDLAVQLNGQWQFVQVTPWRDAHGLDWLVVVTLPESDFMGQINANRRTTILLCFGALAVSSLMGLFTARRIAQPVLRLSQASEAVASGNLDQTVEQSGIQELNVLSNAFNHMAGQLRSSFTELEQSKQELEDRVEDRTAELKNTLAELQRTQTQVVQSEKMSSLGQLVAGVAHEINNPVNFIHGNLRHVQEYSQSILSFIQLYQQHSPNPSPEIQEAAEEIDLEFLQQDLPKMLASMQFGTERIRQIVLSLRNFSRMDESEFKAVDIHEGIDSTLLILQHRLKARPTRPEIEIVKDYVTLPLVECYAGMLNQVFMNILANAIDAIDEKHEAGTHEAKNCQNQIQISTLAVEPNSVKISIRDSGTGIPEAVKNRIFDPFFTTKVLGKGTGMGMSISYQIITEKHSGKIECFSTLGVGTEFVLQIPLQQI
ncbi:MAG: HAMP domain-containing protein [Pegethrix bostrychoides GSE-TBD4-15B]|jgi:signal transduction histidine kinase|uniref:histidine kinase n=1 Tax=Pegethrix bostrychoides GSE-TBD4-15B TaxID=2839662 RepID=A0A951PCF4_9CYAN|nr:HAMP domain-containing protein [Pegethrix bostrychoides GSE-TBD4-15B]